MLRLSMALVRLMALLIAAYFMCQYIFRYGPSDAQASLPNHLRNLLALTNTESIMETTSWWRAVCLAAPYAVLVILFFHDLAWTRRRSSKLKLSQIVYERYFGIKGLHYDLKVATLQVLTVLLQALGKLHLMGGVIVFAVQQDSRTTWALKSIFWTFWGLLVFNSLYPAALLVAPKMHVCRYMSAFLDVCLDLGYLLTYLLLIMIGMSELHAEASVFGNFGYIKSLNFTNRTLVKNLFSHLRIVFALNRYLWLIGTFAVKLPPLARLASFRVFPEIPCCGICLGHPRAAKATPIASFGLSPS